MMQQYDQAKAACGDALLLFRMGDFYELFHEDAKIAAEAVGLTLTSRDKSDNPIPMAGFPHHQLESYLAKLIAKGFRAAVCEQVEDPKKASGPVVRREVTRVVTPGTLTDDALLDPRESNYLAALVWSTEAGGRNRAGIAWCDLSTGLFQAATFEDREVADQLARIDPAECLYAEDDDPPPYPGMALAPRPAWAFQADAARKTLCRHFSAASMEGFGFEPPGDEPALRAAGAVLEYLRETQKASLQHIDRLTPYRTATTLEIDAATRRSLELTRTLREGRREGSLISVLDHTVTASGARRLQQWLASPLTEIGEIDRRLEAVEQLSRQPAARADLRAALRETYDLERLVSRVITGRASPRDLCLVGRTLTRLPDIKHQVGLFDAPQLRQVASDMPLASPLQERLAAALEDPCPLQARDGGFIRHGFSRELDLLRELTAGGKQWIAEYQAREAERIDVPNLKVGFNKVFGYYIELTNAHRDKAPDDYFRKQTLKNAERFITPELKQYEEKVLSADEKSKELEYELFQELRSLVEQAAPDLQSAARALATLDVLAGLAELACRQNYCRPQLAEQPVLEIHDGRHPVLDIHRPQGEFVPNDTLAGPDEGLILLITGPNMAGKSTYIRQCALLTIMAQMGSFVPAAAATIGVADRVFARVGASDELSRGQSTFMVEMTETARILNTATSQSLVILDEIGRGTSTYDGVSLAWAIVEHLHEQLGCRTLFATHYHELTELQQSLSSLRNLNVAVREHRGEVAFLHKIVAGAADKSYGIHVARLAGVPSAVNERATEILKQLEAEHLGAPRPASRPREIQLTLFGAPEHPMVDELRNLDLDSTTPLEALQHLQRWQQDALRTDGHDPSRTVTHPK